MLRLWASAVILFGVGVPSVLLVVDGVLDRGAVAMEIPAEPEEREAVITRQARLIDDLQRRHAFTTLALVSAMLASTLGFAVMVGRAKRRDDPDRSGAPAERSRGGA